jgi:hypothetical protein
MRALGGDEHVFIAALGGKAKKRLKGLARYHSAVAPAPPGCNQRQARPSWERLATEFHQWLRTRSSAPPPPRR